MSRIKALKFLQGLRPTPKGLLNAGVNAGVGGLIGGGADMVQQASTGEGISMPQFLGVAAAGALGSHGLGRPGIKGFTRGLAATSLIPRYMESQQKKTYGASMLDPESVRTKLNQGVTGLDKFLNRTIDNYEKNIRPEIRHFNGLRIDEDLVNDIGSRVKRQTEPRWSSVDPEVRQRIMERARRFMGAQ